MPVMHFRVRWPDQSEAWCYSPSVVVRDFLTPGEAYPLPEFLNRTREALNIASDRVREKYGFACSQALDQLADIEAKAREFQHQPNATVAVLAFD